MGLGGSSHGRSCADDYAVNRNYRVMSNYIDNPQPLADAVRTGKPSNDSVLVAIKNSGQYRVSVEGKVETLRKRGGQVPSRDTWRIVENLVGEYKRNQIIYLGKTVYASRLVWFWFNGEIPPGLQVDHIDGNCRNDALSNLRLLTPRQNVIAAEKLGKYKGTRFPSDNRKKAIKRWWSNSGVRDKMSEAARKGWLKRKAQVHVH